MAKIEVLDATKMTYAQLMALAAQRKAEEAKRVAEQGVKIRGEVEQYVQLKYGLSLAQIFTASAKTPTVYTDPKTGKTWSGRGRQPAWVSAQKAAVQPPVAGQDGLQVN
jgi:DNA-binding protein H-NS